MKCKLCGEPLTHKVLLGPDLYPVWMHDYPQLKACKMLTFPQDFVRLMERKAAGMQKVWDRYREQIGETCQADGAGAT